MYKNNCLVSRWQYFWKHNIKNVEKCYAGSNSIVGNKETRYTLLPIARPKPHGTAAASTSPT